jgi:hypothetical protein
MAHVRRTGEVVEQNFDGEHEVDPTAPRLYAEP